MSYESHQRVSWLAPAIERQAIDEAVAAAEIHLGDREFDTIAFTGMSGALFAPIVAYKLHKEIVAIRKPRDGSHSDYDTEGYLHASKYIIIDDFVSSGRTVKRIIKEMLKFAPAAQLVGIYTYYPAYTGMPLGWTPFESENLLGKYLADVKKEILDQSVSQAAL